MKFKIFIDENKLYHVYTFKKCLFNKLKVMSYYRTFEDIDTILKMLVIDKVRPDNHNLILFNGGKEKKLVLDDTTYFDNYILAA